jgi:hypothetical protein
MSGKTNTVDSFPNLTWRAPCETNVDYNDYGKLSLYRRTWLFMIALSVRDRSHGRRHK